MKMTMTTMTKTMAMITVIIILSKCYQPQPAVSADNTYLDLDYSGYHKNLIQ